MSGDAQTLAAPPEPAPDEVETVAADAGDDVAPVSAIEKYSYCPRQCALIHIEQIFEENVYTMRSRLVHERVDMGEETTEGDVRVVRSMPLWSKRLGLTGKADVVEFGPAGPYPVEYKPGRRHGIHADVQLCAQALCLEEMLGAPVERGAIYYGETHARHEVVFDTALRRKTEQAIQGVHELLAGQRVPPPVNDGRCPTCSLVEVCLPGVVAEPARLRGLQSTLFQTFDERGDEATIA
jgi:CRISPR-associated exonuclease Cas4